jgi:rod shape determining protein RodA
MMVITQKKPLKSFPYTLVVSVALAAGIGVYNLASAARSPLNLWQSQVWYLGFSILAATVVVLVRMKWLLRLVPLIYLANVVALILLRFFGHTAKGAEGWFALGSVRVQPAEFMKIALVMMLAKFFHDDEKDRPNGYGFLDLLPPAVLAFGPTLLVLAQPDLGTALMMAFTSITLLLFSRPSNAVWLAFGLTVVGSIGVLYNDYVRPQNDPRYTVIRHKLKKHQDARISGWLAPDSDLKGTNYQARQSKIAVGSGGTSGKGWRQGTQTGLRFLPEQHTDFIFSVFAEEQGFWSCVLLLALYGVVLIASLVVAMKTKERFGVYACVGIAAMIFWQVFENIGMVSGLMPITGITLPLMSYGGSSMLSVMLGLGLVVNVSMQRSK